MVINGHLAWMCQNASSNCGDDFQALKLSELQPYTWLHLNQETAIYSVLGMQGEEKAGKCEKTLMPYFSICLNCYAENQSHVLCVHHASLP